MLYNTVIKYRHRRDAINRVSTHNRKKNNKIA